MGNTTLCRYHNDILNGNIYSMGILDIFKSDVPRSKFKTTHQFYEENYFGVPEIRTKFDGLWNSAVTIYGREGRADMQHFAKGESKEKVMAKAQQWMQNTMEREYKPEAKD